MFTPLRWLVQSVVKVAISATAGSGVALLAIGVLAMFDPDAGIWRVLDHYGPPIGPLFLSIGAGLATMGGTLYGLFFPAPRPWARVNGRGCALRGGCEGVSSEQ